MTKAKFIGARLENEYLEMVDKTAEEENMDRTRALKELITMGRKELLLRKYLELYRNGRCSIDKAAEMVGLTVGEMMQEAVKEGIRSTETIDEYKRGFIHLK